MGATESYNKTLGGKDYVEEFVQISTPYLLVTSLAAVVGIVGNLLVLAAIAINPKLHRAGSVFMVNLAVADLIVAGFMDPLSLAGMIKGHHFFTARPGLCDVAAMICVSVCVCALLSIGAISFQQFVHICHPHHYTSVFNLCHNMLFCAGFWLVGFLVSLPSILGWTDNVYDAKTLECIWDRTHNISYTIFYMCVAVFLPLIIISYSYTCIFLHVRASRCRLQRLQQNGSPGRAPIPASPAATPASLPAAGILPTNDAASPPTAANGKLKKDPTRLARTLFFIFLVFAICWTPYSVLVVVDYKDKLPHEVHLFALLLAHLHATADPIVYGITNRHFQQGYRRILKLLICKSGHDIVARKDYV